MSNPPYLTVLLPVYNGAQFLNKAIDSILNQTYKDFELIIINDGSTDNSEKIILSYNDPRIIYKVNGQNEGLIKTLNIGIQNAQGTYIARMDADDICHPYRFEKQIKFLHDFQDVDMVASTVRFIDIQGNDCGQWPVDQKTIAYRQIKRTMLLENCIAHPSVMGKTPIFKLLKYRESQTHMEDYDLWLRLLNQGYTIAKINEPLLLYRIHSKSVTKEHIQKSNFFFKVAAMKKRLLLYLLQKHQLNAYSLWISLSLVRDIFQGLGKEVKRRMVKRK
ncbi:MAG: hypothetical protein NVSMB67_23800 [Flavisolibacter sp.]